MGSDSRGELRDLLASYVDRLNEGEGLDPDTILAENPLHGALILEYLENYVAVSASADGNHPLRTLGDYTLRRQIGRGGMGVVYEAWQGSMNRVVALKVLPAGVAADQKACARFMREARTTGQLNHRNVVSVYSTGIEEGTPWYSMELVEGETLAKIKDAELDTETPFGPKDQVDYFAKLARAFADVADGVQHAHSKGVTHRDIKPSNLILDSDGRLRILDFGLARLEGQESLTLSGDFIGTPLYMSPEQARRRKIDVDHRTDVYSLGATMYEALCRQPPFRGKDHADTLSQIIERDPIEPRKANARVPKELETIVLKCLRKDPADRYGTAEALQQDLQRFVRGDPIEARPPSGWERAARVLRRHAWGLTLLGVASVVVLLVGILGWDRWQAIREERVRGFEEKVRAAAMKIHRSELTISAVSQRDKVVHHFNRWSAVGVERDDFAGFAEARRKILVEAVGNLEAAARSFPRRPVTYYYLARAHLRLGAQELARNALERGLRSSRPFVPLRVLLAELDGGELPDAPATLEDWEHQWLMAFEAEREEDWSRAAQVYGKLLSSLDRKEEPYLGALVELTLRRGTARLRAGQLFDALADFAGARALWPNVLEPALLLGKTLCLLGQPEAAERTFRGILEDAEKNKTEVATWVAAIYGELQDFRKRDEWACLGGEALSLRLDGWALWFEGKHRQAEQAFRTSLKADSLDTLSLLGLGYSLLSTLEGRSGPQRDQELRELLDIASQAVEAWPHERFAETVHGPAFHAHALSALAHMAAGDLERASEAAQRTIELGGERPALGCLVYGLVLEKKGDLTAAERYLRRAIEINPDRGGWKQRHLSRVLAKDGRLAEAVKYLLDSIAIEPKLASAYGDLAGLLIEKGELEQAVAAGREAVARFPRNNAGHENLAEALWRLGEPERALVVVNRGVEFVPDRVRLHVVRGWILGDLGRVAEAARSFDEALRLDPDCDEARESRESLRKRNAHRLDEQGDILVPLGAPSRMLYALKVNKPTSALGECRLALRATT